MIMIAVDHPREIMARDHTSMFSPGKDLHHAHKNQLKQTLTLVNENSLVRILRPI